MKKPNILYLGQTPFFNKLDSAPKVRTYYLHKAFKEIANVTFINGNRTNRIPSLLAHLKSFPKDYYDAAYLEAATSTSTPVDIAMLYHLKRKRIPLGIFIRDIYPLFDLSPRDTLKEKLLYQSWFMSQYFYRQTATVLFYPSQSFADNLDFPRYALLPPGARKDSLPPPNTPTDAPHIVFYSGRLNASNGGDMIFKVMDEAVKKHSHIKLLILSNSPIPRPWDKAKWLIHIKGSLKDIVPYASEILCGVIPRPINTYNHLAMPIKATDYLSLGLPLLVTRCHEMAQFVTHENVGLTCEYSASDMLKHLLIMLENPEKQQQFREAVRDAVLHRHNWTIRAQTIIDNLL